MNPTLDELLPQIGHLDKLRFVMVSNQDNGISTYTNAFLKYFPSDQSIGNIGSGRFLPDRLEGDAEMLFSDRPETASQKFDVRSPEPLGISISLGVAHVMTLSLFGTKTRVTLNAMGDLHVGLGPSMGHSGAGVFVVSFPGIYRGV